ncbi:hypothetical protein [Saccharopolyspora pogona]|uniref:hypothetical protein n=1 Tax=Saccharopolyspora pogona TaxID=333966 RepID=UPI001CC24316|nr:hypothetical protein [Saccharopolyspora pogona]
MNAAVVEGMCTVDTGALTRAADLLTSARRLLLVGNGGSAFVAQAAVLRSVSIGCPADAPADAVTQQITARLLGLGPEGVCVPIGSSGASAWTDYFWPALVLQRTDLVLQIGVRSFLFAEDENWGAVMADSGLACLPIFALYLLLQRQVLDAFVRSGLR